MHSLEQLRCLICPRMDSMDCLPSVRKRAKRGLSSRDKPSRRCSGSIIEAPNWEASYRAKKTTRRAISVYRSNISPFAYLKQKEPTASSHSSTKNRPPVDIQNLAIDVTGPFAAQKNYGPRDIFRSG